MAQSTSCHSAVHVEKPNSATAVRATDAAVSLPVPRRRTSVSVMRLETMVPRQMTTDIAPASDTAAPRSACMAGHAAPRRPSGSPRLTNAR
jgi:hypothetical protein